jgi:hypothetical protein
MAGFHGRARLKSGSHTPIQAKGACVGRPSLPTRLQACLPEVKGARIGFGHDTSEET